MSYLTAEQVIAANKANVETLFGLTNKAFEGVEKLVELNLQVAKAALSEAADTTKAAMSVKDAQELFALQAGLLQPAAEKAAAYSRHLYDILAGTGAEFTKAAEGNLADAQKKVLSLVDNAVKNAPAGTESAVALVKSAVAAANNGDMLCTLATLGLGIARLADYHVDAELKSGQLVKLLDAHELEREPIYAVFASKRHLSPRVRVFLDHARQALGDG